MPVCAQGSDAEQGESVSAGDMDAPCGRLEIATAGMMAPADYDAAIYDVVNFLAYTAEPIKLERQRIGMYVMLFLAVFFMFAWLLSREYWKDVD